MMWLKTHQLPESMRRHIESWLNSAPVSLYLEYSQFLGQLTKNKRRNINNTT